MSEALAPGSIKAETQRSFSARDQRRRLSTDVMTSMRFMALRLTPGIVTVSYGQTGCERRPSSEEYLASYVLNLQRARKLCAAARPDALRSVPLSKQVREDNA